MTRGWTRRRLLRATAALAGWAGLPRWARAESGPAVRVGWVAVPGASIEVARGVELGAGEAQRLLALLRGTFLLERASGTAVAGLRALHARGVEAVVLPVAPAAALAAVRAAGFPGVVVATEAGEPAAQPSPPQVLAVATPPAQRRAALVAWAARQRPPSAVRFAARPERARDVVWASDWHPSLDRNGGAQLNARYAQRFHQPMEEAAWHGWTAVKALSEAAVRARDGLRRAIAALALDAHVGAALRFDERGVLEHPLFVVRGDGSALGELVGSAAR